MSYYFVIVGPRDDPLYEADLAARSGGSVGPSSLLTSSTIAVNGNDKSKDKSQPEDRSGPFGAGAPLGSLPGAVSAIPVGTGRGAHASAGLSFGRYNDKDVLQMIAHSSLDAVEDMALYDGALYLRAVDRINEWTTSAFVVPGGTRFLILHEHKHDEGIRNFFLDVWELWVKLNLNPLREPDSPVLSSSFDSRVRASARRYL